MPSVFAAEIIQLTTQNFEETRQQIVASNGLLWLRFYDSKTATSLEQDFRFVAGNFNHFIPHFFAHVNCEESDLCRYFQIAETPSIMLLNPELYVAMHYNLSTPITKDAFREFTDSIDWLDDDYYDDYDDDEETKEFVDGGIIQFTAEPRPLTVKKEPTTLLPDETFLGNPIQEMPTHWEDFKSLFTPMVSVVHTWFESLVNVFLIAPIRNMYIGGFAVIAAVFVSAYFTPERKEKDV